jgi:carbon-monoxide dehydrogenase large subunit
MSARNSYVGSPVDRIEDLRFLRGRGEYVDDITRDGLLHMAVLRSSVAHGRIKAIDTAAAKARPGVHAVFIAADIGPVMPKIPLRTFHFKVTPETERYLQPVIALGKVRYVGEPIAIVIADSAALAEDALEDIAVDIEPLPPRAETPAAQRDDVLLFEDTPTNLAATVTCLRGDADRGFREAEYTRREKFSIQRHTAITMELRGLLTEWDAAQGKMTVSGAAKLPFFSRRVLAKMMGLAEESVVMIENDVGGGFGVRGEFYPEDFLVPFAARQLGRPVKWIEDRREHMLATNHAREVECEVEIACRRDGKILALRGFAYVNAGAYLRPSGLGAPHNVTQMMAGPYNMPHLNLVSKTYVTNKSPAGTYRAPGRFESNFVCERLVDLAAQDLGIDPVEMRRRNLVLESEMPYEIGQFTSDTPGSHKECYDSGDYSITLDLCLKEFGWAEKQHIQGKLIDGRYHGLGIACFIEGGAGGFKEDARVVIEPDGSVSVFVGCSALGQGLETAFAQIAADALEIPMTAIKGVYHGSTTLVREGVGSWHSRATVMGGSAIILAATNLKDAIRKHVAERFGCTATEIEISDGIAKAPGGRSVTFSELAGQRLAGEATFHNHLHTYTYGTHCAHVTVDPKTGHVGIVDYLAVQDVGRIINPKTLRGQSIGSMVQGLGGTFLEHLVYDEHGQLLTGSLADYLMPTASDYPNIRSIELEMKPSPVNPLGAKGAGESGIISAPSVMANAVAAALSSLKVQPNGLPLSPQRVWGLIQAARQKNQ